MMPDQTLTGYASIDKPWLKYYDQGASHASLPHCTVYDFLYQRNQDHLDDIALLYFGKRITYRSFFHNIMLLEKALIQNGVKLGDNIAICMPAIPETYYLILALNKIGANANLLNPTFTENQLADRISESGSSILFVVNELFARVENIYKRAGIRKVITCPAVNSLGSITKIIKRVKPIKGTISWNTFVSDSKRCSLSNPYTYQSNTPAITVYSSGTTGASKGILHTNESITAIISQYQISNFPVERKKRYFAQIPIWFSTGIIVTMLVPLAYGITVIPVPIYDFKLFDKLITKYRPNYIVTASGLLEFLKNEHPQYPPCKDFIIMAAGGDYVTKQAEISINDWLKSNGASIQLFKGYGMCECGGTVTTTSNQCNKIGSAGIPLPQMTVSAFDSKNNKELKYGERGELRVLTPGHMLGYYKNDKATDNYFYRDENGLLWACTGDMGYVDQDGAVFVAGRINDSYRNKQNELIYLFDIEHAITDHKDVRQCKVITSQVNGQNTHIANVVLTESADIHDVLRDIYNHCSNVLPANHVPHFFKIYNSSLPVAPSGKLDTAKMSNDAISLLEIG